MNKIIEVYIGRRFLIIDEVEDVGLYMFICIVGVVGLGVEVLGVEGMVGFFLMKLLFVISLVK